MANLNFNAQTVEPQAAFDPLPAGWYQMQIVESELKPTSNGEGQYLQLKLQVVAGEHASRVVFERLNIVNRNPTAQEIAYRTLSSICHATGVIQVEDSQQLHGIPMEVKVSVRPAKDGYDASNDVKGYRAINAGMMQAAPAQGGFPAQAQPQQAPQGGQWTPGGLPQNAQQQPAWQQPQQAPAPQQGWQQPAQQIPRSFRRGKAPGYSDSGRFPFGQQAKNAECSGAPPGLLLALCFLPTVRRCWPENPDRRGWLQCMTGPCLYCPTGRNSRRPRLATGIGAGAGLCGAGHSWL